MSAPMCVASLSVGMTTLVGGRRAVFAAEWMAM
jgi:hypothetical protein